jgi:hypothetical protein
VIAPQERDLQEPTARIADGEHIGEALGAREEPFERRPSGSGLGRGSGFGELGPDRQYLSNG